MLQHPSTPLSQEPNDMNHKKARLESTTALFIKKEYRIEIVEDLDCNRDKDTDVRNQRPEKQKKKRGQNKFKDRKVNRADDAVQLCFAVATGGKCEREKCKFSHDVEVYLAAKDEDLQGNCPNMVAHGICRFGVKCRFLHSHISLKGGEIFEESTIIQNIVSREFQKQIRSNFFDLSRSKAFEEMHTAFHANGKRNGSVEVQKEEDIIDSSLKADESADTILPSNEHSDKLDRFELDQKDVRIRLVEKKRLEFRGKSYLAPLTTVGNLPFRRICKEYGVDVTCAEMALTGNLMAGTQGEWTLMKRHKSEDIFGVQVTGNHPVSFTKICDVLQQNLSFDFLDINLGCPVEAITAKGCGSALMERRSKLREMIIGANSVLDVPLTVKIRTAVRDKTLLAHKLIPQFQVAGITLHGRSKEQRYSKLANWDYIAECSTLIDRSKERYPFFFGNGDMFCPEDYAKILNENLTVDGVMIGRGALIKPWIFTEIKNHSLWDITANERLEILQKYANYGMEFWGSDTQGINQTRKFLCDWLSFLHRYVPVGLIEVLPQKMNLRAEKFKGRNELETLMASDSSLDWIKLSEIVLGKAPPSFSFIPK